MNRFLFLAVIIFLLSCNNGSESTTTTTTTTNTNTKANEQAENNRKLDSIMAPEHDDVQPYVGRFSSKEVFFALVQRRFEKDTLPPIIKDNYSPQEIENTRRKIVQLRTLTNLQMLDLYRISNPNKVIYGKDDREPVFYDVNNINISAGEYMDDAKKVVAIIPRYNLRRDAATGNYIIYPKGIFKNEYNLCDKERFCNEPVTAHCTGFCVSPTQIVTASHCIDRATMRNFYFVFDYLADSNGNYSNIVPADKVYQAIAYEEGSPNHPNTDFAIIRIDKTIPQYRIARVNRNVNYDPNQAGPYHVIGFPCGIPMKLAPNAVFRSEIDQNFFVINSDTYGGNSGSPVFNTISHEVEGILVQGYQDFKLNTGQCFISFLCPFNGCSGESVSKNSQYVNYIH
jgi:hypothetical protein